uniref:Endonuclease/exonuclease/phosphatase domain-containing protein n=1 Tax=Salix viminalis TaxID=40686 RepID=A0A6N2MQM5_SALVM
MSVSLTVMTFNLHEDQAEDSPNSWEKRKDLCISVITSYSPMILCTQQGVKTQLDYLQQCLPGYGQFGISRKGSQDASDEHCSIFYDKEKVELLEGGTFWLSESPSVPGSMSWGAAVPCIATWAISFPILGSVNFTFPRARRRSALLTWQHIASLPPSLPVVYCGGFNTQKESTTGRFLLGRSREHGVVGDMRDTWPNARVRKNPSLIHTYHGFKGDKQGALEFFKLILRALCLCWDRQTQDLHVDWILFRGRSLIPVLCEVVNDNIDGHYPSSHYPIFSEFMLPRSVRLLEPPPPPQEENPVALNAKSIDYHSSIPKRTKQNEKPPPARRSFSSSIPISYCQSRNTEKTKKLN